MTIVRSLRKSHQCRKNGGSDKGDSGDSGRQSFHRSAPKICTTLPYRPTGDCCSCSTVEGKVRSSSTVPTIEEDDLTVSVAGIWGDKTADPNLRGRLIGDERSEERRVGKECRC